MKTKTSFLILSICLMTTACSGGLIRGEPPMVGLATIKLEPRALNARVAIYNPNDVELPVESVEMAMTLGDTDLGTHMAQPDIIIHPNGTEEISFSFPEDETAGATLTELENKEINSAPYKITGRVIAADGDSEKFSQEGYLYPIPGRPGEFRGAGPQSDRPR